jgi:DNA-directed RNA polymerase specialized sigma subunit
MLDSPSLVIRSLLTYTDWWQPTTASVMKTSSTRRRGERPDGFREGLLDTLDERSELCRRMALLDERERGVLFLWYVAQKTVAEISREVKVSRRQCFRLRAGSIRKLVQFGEPEEAA